MRRTVTLRTTLQALIVAPVLLTALAASAEETPAIVSPTIVSIVTGLAPGDLLNIRAKPSPMGKTEARLPDGSSVNNLGCNDIDGHQWCKVQDIENPRVSGWTPARYLNPINPTAIVDAALSADTPSVANAGTIGGTAASAPVKEPSLATLPPDLTERLGGTGQVASPSVATIAMQDAYGLAFAAQENPMTGEIEDPTAEQEPARLPVPVPTQRPDQADATSAADTLTVARAEPQAALSAADAPSEIPCARYVGQPMVGCRTSVVHTDGNKAQVTVSWPDGGTRVISFDAGQPAGSDSPSDFRFTREGSLNMIRVGVSERFEITDAQALGD
ncbi:SH3 domain-containing protein [Mesorhizobium sp. INR15]|uniref:SH3 domain-containing protein n=1 Tax=Mesorhizobium sp. INR15 TaxID=2654248 RepID=UPI00189676A2|nr:SH3 domain-containing protein [Mesorhizobium sp. INR15]QPC91372.1 SH3 domain-containing protein [Mesorhizobium sp. INR15]